MPSFAARAVARLSSGSPAFSISAEEAVAVSDLLTSHTSVDVEIVYCMSHKRVE